MRGGFQLPQLLQLSGIGPGRLLQDRNIPPFIDLPGVGESLHDHFTATISFACTRNITISDMIASPWSKIGRGLQYLLFRKGLLATNGQFGTGFIRTDPTLPIPDVRLHMNLWTRPTQRKRGASDNAGLHHDSSFGISIHIVHPDSRGTVRIKSANPTDAPEIHFDLFKTERDQMAAVKALRAARHIMSLPPVSQYVASEKEPGRDAQSDEDIIRFVRANGRPNNHSVGTCQMGINDKAVVDPKLRVKGVAGLRVVDASIMPRVVATNTNAATVMIGEKGAAMIIEDARA